MTGYQNRRSNGISRWWEEGGRVLPTTAWNFSRSLSLWTLMGHLPECLNFHTFSSQPNLVFAASQWNGICTQCVLTLSDNPTNNTSVKFKERIKKISPRKMSGITYFKSSPRMAFKDMKSPNKGLPCLSFWAAVTQLKFKVQSVLNSEGKRKTSSATELQPNLRNRYSISLFSPPVPTPAQHFNYTKLQSKCCWII